MIRDLLVIGGLLVSLAGAVALDWRAALVLVGCQAFFVGVLLLRAWRLQQRELQETIKENHHAA